MPHSFKKPCKYPGCPNLTNERYCEVHKKEMRIKYDKYIRSPDYKKRYGNDWVKLRKAYIQEHPLCELCKKENRLVPAQEVHHIIPLDRGGTNDLNNLISLCHRCHIKEHIKLGDRHGNINDP